MLPPDFHGVMMQAFHWYLTSDKPLWVELAQTAKELKEAGVDAIWVPPAYKGESGANDVGYSTYDLFDLGEFDQKGSVATKYGTKDEFMQMIEACKEADLHVYLDTVFNHKFGADEVEQVEARPVDWDNREQVVDGYRTIGAYTKFTFPGRQGKYSSMTWDHTHFDAVDYDDNTKESHIFLLKGKSFEKDLDLEKGNFDYLMGSDLDMESEEVRGDLKYWGEWVLDLTNCAGFRLDAVKHISRKFFDEWITHMSEYSKEKHGRDVFFVGEYLSSDMGALEFYSHCADGRMHLFDFPLHFNFHKAAVENENYDMRQIFDGTLLAMNPNIAVTFVENHDSQPGQAFGDSAIPENFKTIAYALILLRKNGYPCIFYADYFGAKYTEKGNEYELISHKVFLDHLLCARKEYMKGDCYDYFNQQSILGWCYRGATPEDKAMAIVVSNAGAGSERMEVARPGAEFKELTGAIEDVITVDDDGWADFPVEGKAVAVWVQQ